MNINFFQELFIYRIDDIVISLMTGIISSLFISRIFLISQSEKEKFSRIQSRTEILYGIGGALDFTIAYLDGSFPEIQDLKISEDRLLELLTNQVRPILELESYKFLEMILMIWMIKDDYSKMISYAYDQAVRTEQRIREGLKFYFNESEIVLRKTKYYYKVPIVADHMGYVST